MLATAGAVFRCVVSAHGGAEIVPSVMEFVFPASDAVVPTQTRHPLTFTSVVCSVNLPIEGFFSNGFSDVSLYPLIFIQAL